MKPENEMTTDEWNALIATRSYANKYPMDWTKEESRQSVHDMMELTKSIIRPFMKTQVGRNAIRQVFGCRIEGYEEEEKGLPIAEWFRNKR